MKFNERKTISLCRDLTSSFGHIKLTHLAKPETMEITLEGETIIPERFNIYGEPIFSEEMTMLYEWKQDQIRRNPETKNFNLEFDISYELQDFTVSRDEFDTVEGISKSLTNLGTFRDMLNNRRLWRKYTEEKIYLNEFVVFGRYKLDVFGQVLTITSENIPDLPEVCTLDYFNSKVPQYSASFTTYIPDEGSCCPCCGKKFTIDDLRSTVFDLTNGKISHDSCRRNYYHNKEIDKISRCLVDLVYDENPKFDLLSNGYCNRECCTHIPWFMFHTSDGDIKIGWRKRVISIEWQENFKPFNMEIFDDENVTKWGNTGVRGIHAWGTDKAYEYLKKVKEVVNPKS